MASIRQRVYVSEKIGPKQSFTPEGFLLCEEVPVARTGMMLYGPDETPIKAGPDGIVKIFREVEDVFSPATVASANGKSVANDHPDDDVVPENWKELTVGFMMNPRRGEGAMDDLLLADLLLTTPEGIKAVQSGKIEVSLGYDADYEEVSPGVGRQSNIIINHVALVEQGRCGPRCSIGDKKLKQEKELNVAKKSNKFLDALMKAFKAKDAEEVEQLAKEVADDFDDVPPSDDKDIHIHLNGNEDGDPAVSGRTTFSDDDIQAHMDQNAAEHAEMMSRIEALEARLNGGSAGAGAGDDIDPEMVEAMADEVPEGLEKEAVASAKDSAMFRDSFQDTIAMAEILVPGIKVPTFDSAARPAQTFKKICGLRKQALDIAYVQPNTRAVIDDLLGGRVLDTKNMTCDAARTLFRGAAAAQRVVNNTSGGKRVADTQGGARAIKSIADINKMNAERYKTN